MSYPLDDVAKRAVVGRKYEFLAGYKLHELGGFGIIFPPWKIRDEDEDRKPYESTSDIFAFLHVSVKQRLEIIEIKSKDAYFTNDPASWPFDDVTLFNSNKKVHPFAVVFVSQQTNGMLVVPQDGRWGTSMQADPARGANYKCVNAPTESLITLENFIPILTAACQDPAS